MSKARTIRAIPRLNLLSSHLTSTETVNSIPRLHTTRRTSTMASTFPSSTQPDHPLTMVPGPIEFDDKVLAGMAHPAEAHTTKTFIQTFGESLTMLRTLFLSKDTEAQPFVISGSGTLGWDAVGANLIERGESALVLNTGYFSDSFADCLRVYGAEVDQLRSTVIGDKPQLADIEAALKAKKYKLITITHVDTSTGVLSDIEAVSKLVRKVSPDTLVVVDGVCSVAVEEIRFDEWNLDFVLTASQKGIGAPPGLSILFASARAINTINSRKTPIGSYFVDLTRWAPIMKNYEAGNPSYFATPAVQNIHSLHESLLQYATSKDAVELRFKQHTQASDRVKDFIASLGLKTVSVNREASAHGMTAVYLPEGVTNAKLLPLILSQGIVLAGGIHKEIATKYFRIGHMGVSAVNPENGHITRVITAVTKALAELGYKH